MGYHIQYGRTMIKTIIDIPGKKRIRRKAYLLILLGAVILACFLWRNPQALHKYLLPGNPEVTGAALSGLVDGIRQGEPVGDAITAFCQEIIDHAYLP